MPTVWYGRMVTSFNSQPPEGGWSLKQRRTFNLKSFNSQPPEGGWAGGVGGDTAAKNRFNSQPPEGGW